MENQAENGIEIPKEITDPDEREIYTLLYKAKKIMDKKEMPYTLLTLLPGPTMALSFLGGCPHCIELIVRKVFQKESTFLSIIMKSLSMHFLSKAKDNMHSSDDTKVQELINYVKKNTSGHN